MLSDTRKLKSGSNLFVNHVSAPEQAILSGFLVDLNLAIAPLPRITGNAAGERKVVGSSMYVRTLVFIILSYSIKVNSKITIQVISNKVIS